jgi:acetoin utilization deacetylase AcuC-like enzyme
VPSELTAIVRDDAFAGHDTGMHPENPGRYRAILAALGDAGMLDEGRDLPHEPAGDEAILRVHTADHLELLRVITERGGGWVDADTMVASDSLDAARRAAGAAIAAVDAVLDGRRRHAFALGRPPGHHATPNQAMGFCLLNSIAIAAAHARHRGVARVAIVDWDVHHGNGTQDIFYKDGDVRYASIHQSPLYPGTGFPNETGSGAGAGATRNCPLPPGTGDAEWLEAFDSRIAPFIEEGRPDLILLSAGYDAHRDDPIGGCHVTDDGFAALVARTRDLAGRLCDGRLAIVLEGGYDPDALGRCVIRTVCALDSATT